MLTSLINAANIRKMLDPKLPEYSNLNLKNKHLIYTYLIEALVNRTRLNLQPCSATFSIFKMIDRHCLILICALIDVKS